MRRLEALILERWYGRPGGLLLLYPLELVYRLIVRIRARSRRITAQPLPVIVVGNLTVGGTGKSPLVTALAREFIERGYRPGIVSRGYGRSGDDGTALLVSSSASAEEVGDEPLMLSRETGVPVVVARQRRLAVEWLQRETNCDVVIADDGLQHYAMARCIEIALIDGQRGFGNGHCLPLGPLREPAARLQTVDFPLINGDSLEFDTVPRMQITALEWVDVVSGVTSPLAAFSAGPDVLAMTGIGNPARFLDTLASLDLNARPMLFPDHHDFQQEDLKHALAQALPVVMTAKDAVKCGPLLVGQSSGRFFYLRVAAILPEDFVGKLLTLLEQRRSQVQ